MSGLPDRFVVHLSGDSSMGHRAEALAARVQEGAVGLAAFTETVSDAEWKMRVSESDPRTVGQIVNHVALVYPIEMDLARGIADGKSMSHITWEVVAELNANHARQYPQVKKAEVLALLEANSRKAAADVRGYSDAELDRAGPFGLCYDAPVTAQFVIEDHAVRHSWHHLARIRKQLGR